MRQWEALRDVLRRLGHRVDLLEPTPGLPEMAFTANAATVIDGKVLVARSRDESRTAETGAYLDWFRLNGFGTVVCAGAFNEGEGDYLATGGMVLAGTGFRTDRRSHAEVHELFGRPLVALNLVDPRFQHLDTALAVLDHDEIVYYPPAFSASSQGLLRELYPDAIVAGEDAVAFGLGVVSDGRHVVLPEAATGLAAKLREHDYRPIGVELSEIRKAGGSAKRCALRIRGCEQTGSSGESRSSGQKDDDGEFDAPAIDTCP